MRTSKRITHGVTAIACVVVSASLLQVSAASGEQARAALPEAVSAVSGAAKATATAQRVKPPSPPVAAGHFATLPPGAALPSDATCAAAVKPVAEQRQSNNAPNHTTGTLSGGALNLPGVTGNFTGTTDEIIQWAACKWGIDEDIARAQIAKESWWRQDAVGDNGESFGLGQVRVPYHGDAFANNNAGKSSAYNVDYTYYKWRSCYDGKEQWLNTIGGLPYAAGDVWGCLGLWFSGRWHTPGANDYIAAVQDYLNQRIWLTPNFQNG